MVELINSDELEKARIKMKKKKGDISDLLKKGEYIEFTEYSPIKNKFISYFGKVKGYSNDKIRTEGYEIIPENIPHEILKFKFMMGEFNQELIIRSILFDKVKYQYLDQIIDVKQNIVIIDKETYQLMEEWLKLGLPDLFSEYDENASKKEKEKIKQKIEPKLKKAKSKKLKQFLKEIIKDINKSEE